jgi:sec-independent protein translocase protein TatA
MIPKIGLPELIIVLVIIVLVFGVGKLPEVGSAIGKSIREFRKANDELQGTKEDLSKEADKIKKDVEKETEQIKKDVDIS